MARKSKGQAQVLSGSPSSSFTNFSPAAIQANRAPTTADTGYAIGQLWADTNGTTVYGLSAVSAGSATWNLLGPGASDVDTLTGDSGGAISPSGGNITLAGGTNITSAGAGSTITFNLDSSVTIATSVSSPIYTSTGAVDTNINAVAGQDIIMKMGDAAGANKVSFQDSASAEVFSIDSNGAIATLTGLTVAGAFTQTAGVVSISEDNSANAVGIGNGTVGRTLDIGSSAAAHVLTIGSTTGAAQLDLLAGTGNFSITGAATTTYTVGAATDTGDMTLGLSTAGQDILLGSGINTGAQVISIGNGASGANSTVNILSGIGTAGAGTLALGNNTRVTTIGLGDIAPAAARTVTVCGGDSAQNDTLSVMSDNPSAGTQTVTVLGGVPTGGTQALNLLTQTGQAGTVSIGTGAAMANAINIGGTGANTIAIGNTQTAGSVSIGAAMTGGNINIGGTGLQIGDIDLGVGTGAQNINIGTGGTGIKTISVGTGAIDNAITIGTVTGAASLDLLCGTGNFTLEGDVASTYEISSTGINTGTCKFASGTGARTVEIAGGGTGIKTINIGAAATPDVITIGTTTGAGSLSLAAGTGNITLDATVEAIAAKYVVPTGIDITVTQNPTMTSADTGGGVATGATGDLNIMYMQEGVVMEQFILGAGQTIISPRMTSTGLNIALDQVDNEGAEYNFGAARTNSQHAFTIGTSDAFRIDATFTVADASGCEPLLVGFRKSEANNATMTSYTDYASIGLDGAAAVDQVILSTELNSAGNTVTNTTDAFTDGQSHKLSVLVSASGAVTYLIDDSPPAVTAAFTFDNADVVCPFIHFLNGADVAGDVELEALKIGFQ